MSDLVFPYSYPELWVVNMYECSANFKTSNLLQQHVQGLV